MQHTLQLASFLEGLGIKGPYVPGLDFRLVPGIAAADLKQLVNPMLGPQASYGGFQLAGAAQYFGLVVAPLAPGGCVIEDASFFLASGSDYMTYTFSTMPLHTLESGGAMGTGATAQHFTPATPCTTIVRHGAHAVAAPASGPKMYLAQTSVNRYGHEIFVPPGYCCGFQTFVLNSDVYFALKVRDIVEGVGPA